MANTKKLHLHKYFVADRKSGLGLTEIANKYSVSKVTVWNVLKKSGLNILSDKERFFKNVIKGDGCWIWTGCKQKEYGVFGLNRKIIKAHRYSYVFHNGEIKDNLIVRHKCDNPSCVNPNHLELGTGADNMMDRDIRGRNVKGERVHTSKINNEIVKKIRNLYSLGYKQKDIAKTYLIAESNVSLICNKKTWKHV